MPKDTNPAPAPQAAQHMSEQHREQQAALRAAGLQRSNKDDAPRMRLADQIPPETADKYVKRVKNDKLRTNFIDQDDNRGA